MEGTAAFSDFSCWQWRGCASRIESELVVEYLKIQGRFFELIKMSR